MPTNTDHDRELRALYGAQRPEPPETLDDAIRAAARAELAAAAGEAPPPEAQRRMKAPIWAGLAASLLLAVLIVPLLRDTDDVTEHAAADRAPTLIEAEAEAEQATPSSTKDGLAATAPATAARAQDAPAAPRSAPTPSASMAERAAEARPLADPAAFHNPAPAAAAASKADSGIGPASLSHAEARLSDEPAEPGIEIRDGVLVVPASWRRHAACSERLMLPPGEAQGSTLYALIEADRAAQTLRLRSGPLDLVARCEAGGWVLEVGSR
jgi:Meckel syndrome type 1 protein